MTIAIDPPGILVACDSPPIRLEIRGLLRAHEFQVHMAQNGRDCIAAMKENAPDLVLLEAVEQVWDGVEVCRVVKSDPEFMEIPTLILTPEGDVDARLRALRAGAEDALAKPFEKEELLARIGVLLKAGELMRRLRKVRFCSGV